MGTGGHLAQAIAVLDVYRRHQDLRSDSIAELNETGLKLARALAEEVAATVEDLVGDRQEGQHG